MAREMMDYLLDENGDLRIENGDFVVGESTYMHQRKLLKTAPGEYKANPTIGVDAESYIDGKKGNISRAITQQFMQDGMEVKDLTVNTAAAPDNEERVFNNAYYK